MLGISPRIRVHLCSSVVKLLFLGLWPDPPGVTYVDHYPFLGVLPEEAVPLDAPRARRESGNKSWLTAQQSLANYPSRAATITTHYFGCKTQCQFGTRTQTATTTVVDKLRGELKP